MRYPSWKVVPDYFDGRELMKTAGSRKVLVVDAEDEAALNAEILRFQKHQARRWQRAKQDEPESLGNKREFLR